MPRSNVLNFPSDNPSGNSLKVFAIVFHVFVAYMLSWFFQLSESGLGFLIILGLMYNFLVRRRMQSTRYLKSNGVLLVILLVLALLVYQWATLLLLLISALYWLLVGRSGREAPYFLRFHILTALILGFFILMPFLIVNAAVMMLGQLMVLLHVDAVTAPVFGFYLKWIGYVMLALFWGSAGWLSINALMGRTPYIKLVTDNVRHWA